MDGYKISQAAQMTGFTVSALRFYEKEGMVVPDRTPTGYRSYGEKDIEALRFLSHAKRFGLSLPEVARLLDLLQDEECRPVQTLLRQLVEARVAKTQGQISDLVALAARLQRVVTGLGQHTPQGACDDRCGCHGDSHLDGDVETRVDLVSSNTPVVACTLKPHEVVDRVDDWQATVALARVREPIPDGVRLRFGRNVDVAALAALAAAEHECCSFFTFNVAIAPEGITLDVTGPHDAQPLIEAMFGTAA